MGVVELITLALALAGGAYWIVNECYLKRFESETFNEIKNKSKDEIFTIAKSANAENEHAVHEFFSRTSALYFFYVDLGADYKKSFMMWGAFTLILIFSLILGFENLTLVLSMGGFSSVVFGSIIASLCVALLYLLLLVKEMDEKVQLARDYKNAGFDSRLVFEYYKKPRGSVKKLK